MSDLYTEITDHLKQECCNINCEYCNRLNTEFTQDLTPPGEDNIMKGGNNYGLLKES